MLGSTCSRAGYSLLPRTTKRAVDMLAVLGGRVAFAHSSRCSARASAGSCSCSRRRAHRVRRWMLAFEHSLYRHAVLQSIGVDRAAAVTVDIAERWRPSRCGRCSSGCVAAQLRLVPDAAPAMWSPRSIGVLASTPTVRVPGAWLLTTSRRHCWPTSVPRCTWTDRPIGGTWLVKQHFVTTTCAVLIISGGRSISPTQPRMSRVVADVDDPAGTRAAHARERSTDRPRRSGTDRARRRSRRTTRSLAVGASWQWPRSAGSPPSMSREGRSWQRRARAAGPALGRSAQHVGGRDRRRSPARGRVAARRSGGLLPARRSDQRGRRVGLARGVEPAPGRNDRSHERSSRSG